MTHAFLQSGGGSGQGPRAGEQSVWSGELEIDVNLFMPSAPVGAYEGELAVTGTIEPVQKLEGLLRLDGEASVPAIFDGQLAIAGEWAAQVTWAGGYKGYVNVEIPATSVVGSNTLTGGIILLFDNAPWPELQAAMRTVANGGLMVSASGVDCRWRLGSSQVPHQLISYDASTGRARFWIRLASLPKAATILELQFGESINGTVDQQNTPGVYVDCLAAYGPDGEDLTGQGRDLVLTGTGTGDDFVPTVTFAGSNSYALYSGNSPDNTIFHGLNQLTVESGFVPGADAVNSDDGIFSYGPSGGTLDREQTFILRCDADGFYGTGVRCLLAEVRTKRANGTIESVRWEGPTDSVKASATHCSFTFALNKDLSVVIDGNVASASWKGIEPVSGTVATLDGKPVGPTEAPVAGGTPGIRMACNAQGSATGNLNGGIGYARVRAQERSAEARQTEQRCYMDVAGFFGVSGVNLPSDQYLAPTAIPDHHASGIGAQVNLDVIANDREPYGLTKTLDTVGSPTPGAAGTASKVDGKLRFQPGAGFTGLVRVPYVLKSSTDRTSLGATRLSIGTSSMYAYRHPAPWLPADDADIDVWNVPAGGNATWPSQGDFNKALCVVLPANYGLTGVLTMRGGTGNPGLKYRAVYIIGGGIRRSGGEFSFPKNRYRGPGQANPPANTIALPAAFPNGWRGGRIIQASFVASGWGAGIRPTFYMANVDIDCFDALGVRQHWWGDLLRIHTNSSNGSNAGNFVNVFFQKVRASGVFGWTGYAKNSDGSYNYAAESFEPHTDLIQFPTGGIHSVYLGEVDLTVGYQGLFLTRPFSDSPQEFFTVPGSDQVVMDDVALRVLQPTTDLPSTPDTRTGEDFVVLNQDETS